MPSPLHLGDESKLEMPNPFGNLNRAALRKVQAMAQTSAPVKGEQFREVKLSAIVGESPLQMRALFSPEHDDEDRALVESLASDGQRVPVLLVETGDDTGIAYTTLDGHRRLAALRHLECETVKAIIVREATLECDLIALTANVRKHLMPLEQARAVARLRDRHELTLESIAKKVGLSRRYVTELVALPETDPAVQTALEDGSIKAKTALALGQAPREHQPQLAAIAAVNHLSEAEAKRCVTRMQETGETPEQVALSLGLATMGKDPELAARESQAPHSARLRKRSQAKSALGLEMAEALIGGAFPEIEARAAKALAEQAVKQSADAKVLKVAGFLVLSGLAVDQALEAAWPISHNASVRKLLRISDLIIDLRDLAERGRCVPECALLLAALSKQVAGLKQAVRPKQSKRRRRHGTS